MKTQMKVEICRKKEGGWVSSYDREHAVVFFFSFILVFSLSSMEVVATVSSHPFMMLYALCRYDTM